jgi:hypothetical protein
MCVSPHSYLRSSGTVEEARRYEQSRMEAEQEIKLRAFKEMGVMIVTSEEPDVDTPRFR